MSSVVLLIDTELPFGMMVWSAGLAPVKFVEGSGLSLSKGRIEVDEYLRVPDSKGRIFALGDNAITNSNVLPPTASVAEQQAYYISDCFNNYYYKSIIDNENIDNEKNEENELPLPGMVVPALLPYGGFPFEYMNSLLCKSSPKFKYMNRGAMAGMGFGGGVIDLTKSDLPVPKIATSGVAAFLQWRSVYLTKQLSYTNMILSKFSHKSSLFTVHSSNKSSIYNCLVLLLLLLLLLFTKFSHDPFFILSLLFSTYVLVQANCLW
jgi:NADH:ubiquinone reductase (non-electrogenic)